MVASLGEHCGLTIVADQFGQSLQDEHDGCGVILRRLALRTLMIEAAQPGD